MAVTNIRTSAWELAGRQHGVVTRRQLLDLGLTSHAIQHRLDRRRLWQVWRGVYAVGAPRLSREARWMAAVLACGRDATLSHGSAAAHWGMGEYERGGEIEVTVPEPTRRARPGIVVHRRSAPGGVAVVHYGIPVSDPACTVIDVATRLRGDPLEALINAADRLGLVDPETLRAAADAAGRRRGAGHVRAILDRRTFALTDSQLERRFLPIARRAGLPPPETGRKLNGFKVDFFWPALGLVVETDGLRYHRTAAQQARDRVRDQAHAAAGLTTLRFTHDQVAHDPRHVETTLSAVTDRLGGAVGEFGRSSRP